MTYRIELQLLFQLLLQDLTFTIKPILANPLEQFNLTSMIITPTNMDVYLINLVILTIMFNHYFKLTVISIFQTVFYNITNIFNITNTNYFAYNQNVSHILLLRLKLLLQLNFKLKLKLNEYFILNSFGIIDTIIDSITGANISLRSEYYLIKLISLFIFIVSANLIGLIPYTFTVTSYFTITLSLSLAIIATFTIISLLRNGILLINSFIPTGTPFTLAPLLLIIETLSYTGRSISLGTRLAANILAGHSLLHIITEFTLILFNYIFSYDLKLLKLKLNLIDQLDHNLNHNLNHNHNQNHILNQNHNLNLNHILNHNQNHLLNQLLSHLALLSPNLLQLPSYVLLQGPFTLIQLLLLLLPLLLLLTLLLMELIIALLQGYVFLLLTINYLSNAFILH